MQDQFISWISSDNGQVVHVAVFALLVLGGLGFPMPEDIPIIFAGVAAGRGIVSLKFIWLTCYCGVLVADLCVYWIGYFFGPKLLLAGSKSRLFRSATPERIAEVRDGLRKRKLAIIFISRHLFPVRSVTFLTAGALRIPFFEFLFADALAALVSVSIVLYLGYYLGEQLTPEVIGHFLKTAHLYLFGALALFVAIWLFRRHRAAAKPALPVDAATIDTGAAGIVPGDPESADGTKRNML